ncbi:MAG TPA: beta-galactosidase, partial [Opitutales bacterium]|nr:beta-galactosidase [Opitutales bacterium]
MLRSFRRDLVLLFSLAGALAPALAFAQAPAADAPAPVLVPLTTVAPDGKPHKFEARDGQFFIDGQPTLLIAGEMHFGRVQPEDWDTRIKQAKAMGLNAISFYLFWNQVEKKEGQYDFTGMNDVRTVLQLCEKN